MLDLAADYKELSDEMERQLSAQTASIGIQFSDVLIDEQSGIGMARQDMATFMQYQTARAMRDASKQEGGLAGLGAGMAMGNTMAPNIQAAANPGSTVLSKADQLRELKALLDERILTQEEFDAEKKAILAKR